MRGPTRDASRASAGVLAAVSIGPSASGPCTSMPCRLHDSRGADSGTSADDRRVNADRGRRREVGSLCRASATADGRLMCRRVIIGRWRLPHALHGHGGDLFQARGPCSTTPMVALSVVIAIVGGPRRVGSAPGSAAGRDLWRGAGQGRCGHRKHYTGMAGVHVTGGGRRVGERH